MIFKSRKLTSVMLSLAIMFSMVPAFGFAAQAEEEQAVPEINEEETVPEEEPQDEVRTDVSVPVCRSGNTSPQIANSWADIQRYINEAEDSVSIKLGCSVTPAEGDKLITNDGKNVTIDLDDYVVDCEERIGAFYNKSGTMTIVNGTIQNARTNFGGAVNNHGTMILVDINISSCLSNNKGGGIMNFGTLTMNGGSISQCGAGSGGAIYSMYSADTIGQAISVTLNQVVINSNASVGSSNESGNGAGIAVDNGSLTMTGCTISGGRTYCNGSKGGGVYFGSSDEIMTLTDTSIINNEADYGGGICLAAGRAKLSGCTVKENFCVKEGDGLYIDSGAEVTLADHNSIISNKFSTTGEGTGIYQGGTLKLSGYPVIENNGTYDLYLPGDKTINITGVLDDRSVISVSAENAPAIVTEGFTDSGNTNKEVFRGETDYEFTLVDGELYLSYLYAVKYIERTWNETDKKVVSKERVCNSYELLHNSSSSWYTIGKDKKETWYVAQGDITMKGTTLTVRGDVHIILCNGASLRVLDGIEVKTDQSLTIHGQAGDTGYLYAKNNESDAGIGCGPNTGVGNITIQGGIVEAHGGKYAAGIGSGEERQMGSVITILGGDVRAYGGDYGAGIGSGDETGGDNGSIIIYGGTVEANGGYQAAGIGGGNEGNGRHITIWGGNIKACSGKDGQAAGIGGGDDGGGGFITINGGDVYAEAKSEGPGIGGDTNCGTIIINGGKVTAVSKVGSGIGGAAGENLVKGSITINGGDVTAYSEGIARGTDDESEGSTGIGSGFYDYGGGDLKVPITINGGTVIATGSGGSAGIGSAAGGHVYGQITINGGLVIAKSEDITDIDNPGNGAGIGSGARLSNEGGDVKTKIIINGGTVIATAGEDYGCVVRAQAIGRGFDKDRSSAGCQIYDNAKVTSGDSDNSAELQLADNRVSGVRRAFAKIEPCNHPNACYTKIDEDTHRKTCIYCGLDKVEPHSGTDCVCGHHELTREISFSSLEGVNSYSVIENAVLYLPFFEGQIITDGNSFMRVTGWEDQETSVVHKPGSPITIDKNMSFAAVCDKVYRVRFDDTQLGYMSVEQSDGDLIGAAKGETVRFTVTPVDGYRVSKVSYTVCAGEYPLIGFDPVEIIPADDTYQLTMPDLQDIDRLANTVLISAEFEAIPSYTITCETCANGTVSTGEVTTAYAGDSVRVYVEADDGYSVSSVSVNGTPIVPVDGKYFFEMPACDVTVSAEFCFGDGIGARLAGYSLSLDGDIGVNFYMELSDEVIAHKDTAYMKFTIPSGTSAYEADVLVKDAVTIDIDGKTYYVFKCNVSAKDMNSEIKAQIIDGDKAGTEYSYTVQTYAQYILDNTDVAEYAAAAPLVKAMLNYGAYSQIYFGINTDNLANSILTEQEQTLPANVNIVHDDVSVADLPSGVTFEGYSVMLRSEAVLSLFFKNKSGEDVKFYYKGSEIEPVDNSGYLRVKITGITAGELSSDFTVNAGSGSVTCSPMNYCKTILEGNYDDDLKNVVKALYVYSQAADEYSD